MIALLDAPEFAAAKDALSTTLEHVEQARRGRLKFLQDALNRTEDELERVKKQALELPTDIARYRAEIARLEVTTRADILREAMDALKAECWGPPGQAVEVQSQKPHACPRCDEGMRDVEITGNVWWFRRDSINAGTCLRAAAVNADGAIVVDDEGHMTWQYRFRHPAVPPLSEWCDGSGKGGAE